MSDNARFGQTSPDAHGHSTADDDTTGPGTDVLAAVAHELLGNLQRLADRQR